MVRNMASDNGKLYRRIMWDGSNLELNDGDEIEISRGIIAKKGYDYDIRASLILNLSTLIIFRSSVEGAWGSSQPRDFDPPISGYVENIEVSPRKILFDIVEKESSFRYR